MKYKTVILIGLVASSVALAIVVGQQLSAEAMAVIVGVVAGVAASIPTSLIIVWLATRQPLTAAQPVPAPVQAERPEPAAQPRLVVIQPPAQPQVPAYAYGYPQAYNARPQPDMQSFLPAYAAAHPYAPPPRRTFTVIGGEALEGTLPLAWHTEEM
jgi:hypothetical protein